MYLALYEPGGIVRVVDCKRYQTVRAAQRRLASIAVLYFGHDYEIKPDTTPLGIKAVSRDESRRVIRQEHDHAI